MSRLPWGHGQAHRTHTHKTYLAMHHNVINLHVWPRGPISLENSLCATGHMDTPCNVLHFTSSWPSLLSPLWGRCRAKPCSWSRGASEAPAGPAAGRWPSHPLCSYPARAYTAPPCLVFSLSPCRPVAPVSHRPSPEWAYGCTWTPLWLKALRTASLRQLVAHFSDELGNTECRLQPLDYRDLEKGGKHPFVTSSTPCEMFSACFFSAISLNRRCWLYLLFTSSLPHIAPSTLTCCWASWRISQKFCPTKISFKKWDQINAWRTAVLVCKSHCSPSLCLTLTFFQPHSPPLSLSRSLPLPLHDVSQKQFEKFFSFFFYSFKAWS